MDLERRHYLAMTGDSQYLYPNGVAISSLAKHLPTAVHLDYAIPRDWHHSIRREDLDLIGDLAESLNWTFQIVEVPLDAADLPRTRHISSMTFMKPAYFDISDRPQVAFLDGDLIAVDDWSAMFDQISEPVALAAAKENNMQKFERHWAPSLSPGWYFNAGVLKARPSLWRIEYTNRWRQLLNEFDTHGFSLLEQDVMNAAVMGRAGYLDPRLNYRPAYDTNLEGAILVHFAGWWKPWLTVRHELKGLPSHFRASYLLFTAAEEQFLHHVTTHQGPHVAAKWRQAKLQLRGRAGWRAHRRYLRWALAQKARNLRDRGHTSQETTS